MHICEVPGCQGHLGKYPNCLAEALWELGEHYAEESGGDCEGPGFSMLFLFDEGKRLSDLDEDICDYAGIPDFIIGSGTYVLLTEVNSGQVFMERFASADEARSAYEDHRIAHERWLEANDE